MYPKKEFMIIQQIFKGNQKYNGCALKGAYAKKKKKVLANDVNFLRNGGMMLFSV